ncbi:MAG: YncE family protein [Cyanobacteriota bacterium]
MKYRGLLVALTFLIASSFVVVNDVALADAGLSNDLSSKSNDNVRIVNHFRLLNQATVELAGNIQKPGITPKGDTILVPAKDLDQLYYITMVQDTPVLNKFTIPTGKGPVDVVISKNGKRAYVANETGKSISIIRLEEEDSSRVTDIAIDGSPCRLALGKDGKYLYVLTKDAEDNVVVIKLGDENSELVNLIPVGEGPHSLKISENGNMAYVVNRGDNTITEIDLTSPEGTIFKDKIDVGVYPTDIAVNKEGNIALVTNALSNNVSLYDPNENPITIFGTIGNLAKPFGIAYDPIGNFAVAMSYYNGKLEFYDLQNASQRIVSPLQDADVTIDEKGEYITLCEKGLIAVSHPNKDILSVIDYNIEKEEIVIPVVPEPTANQNPMPGINDITKLLESQETQDTQNQKPVDDSSAEDIIQDVIKDQGDPLRGRTKAE